MNKNQISKLKELRRVIQNIFFGPFLIKDYLKFKRLNDQRFNLSVLGMFSFIFDSTKFTSFDRHYTYHTAWAARKVKEINPELHIDISSSLYFSTIVSAFIPVKFFDYRPAKVQLSNLESEEADLIRLHFQTDSIQSLSCMHTVEHVGLGRYGDPIDPEGDLKAINELKRVLAVGGNLIFVVPIGKSVLRFNAMRIYSYDQIMSYFSDLKLIEFSLIHEYEEDGEISINASKNQADLEGYACGCFWFTKL